MMRISSSHCCFYVFSSLAILSWKKEETVVVSGFVHTQQDVSSRRRRLTDRSSLHQQQQQYALGRTSFVPWLPPPPPRQIITTTTTFMTLDDDDVATIPWELNSIDWLPSTRELMSKLGDESSIQLEDGVETSNESSTSTIFPCFPIGGSVYFPGSSEQLQIYEKRYQDMYKDIMDESKGNDDGDSSNSTTTKKADNKKKKNKFIAVLLAHPTEQGVFAKYGVLFQVENIQETKEQDGRTKYLVTHKVVGRVYVHRIVNPSAWEGKDTFVKVEGIRIIEDQPDVVSEDMEYIKEKMVEGRAADIVAAEEAFQKVYATLVDVQHESDEGVRFAKESVGRLLNPEGLASWRVAALWKAYGEGRLKARNNELQHDFQLKLQDFLRKAKGLGPKDPVPKQVFLEDLSPKLQEEVVQLQNRINKELEPLIHEQMVGLQLLLESKSYADRIRLLTRLMEEEQQRLAAKLSLKVMLGEGPGNEKPIVEGNVVQEEEKEKAQWFSDEGDAFQ